MWNLERRDKLEALKKKLRKRLAASANGRLQSKRSLAKEFGVSPTTISRITRSFKDEGRVCCVPGQGVFALGADGERPLNFTPLFGLTGCYVGTASAHPDEMTSAIAGIPLLSGVQESSLAAKCALTLMPWGAMGFDAELARELGLSGLIIVGGAPEDELLKVVRTGIPAILANYPATSAPLLPFIDFDNERALRECVEALRAKGRRRPVFLTLGSHSVPGYGRWLKERLIIALAENGFSYDSAHYIQVEGGCEAASAEAECSVF
jgi:DNA-binding LacI/PurR family transcriptional regulator